MKIFFRVDSSFKIGSGHLMRCLTLAESLKERNAYSIFLCRELPGNVSYLAENKGFNVIRLASNDPWQKVMNSSVNKYAEWLGTSWTADAEETISIVKEKFFDWLIVDHYSLDYRWQSKMRPYVGKIMVIDDIANRKHDCDLLLDQNLYPKMETRYAKLVPNSCNQLLGPKYAILHNQFIQNRNKLKTRDGHVKRVFVFLGGSDQNNETEKVLMAAFQSGLTDMKIDVIVGSKNPHKDSIKKLCEEKLPNSTFYCQINNMAELMANADFAFLTGGTVTWERCCLGLPAIVVAAEENQIPLSLFNAKLGLCLYLGKADKVSIEMIQSALHIFCNAPELLQSFSANSMKIVDGRGVDRVINSLIPIEISLRQAGLNDCDSIYQWRNAEEVRKYSFDPQPIPIKTHRKWFQGVLGDPNRLIFIAEIDEKAVGVLRYDIIKDEAIVSIYLVPENNIAGTGTTIIQNGNDWLRKNRPDIKAVRADVLPKNFVSQKVFTSAGFEIYNYAFKYDLTSFSEAIDKKEE